MGPLARSEMCALKFGRRPADFLADNAHPREYYNRPLEELDELEFEKEDYSESTTDLLDRIEECGSSTSRQGVLALQRI